MRKKDAKSGMFVQISDRPLVKKSYMVDPAHEEQLRSLLGEGETISDKVREAIAYYLKSNCEVVGVLAVPVDSVSVALASLRASPPNPKGS